VTPAGDRHAQVVRPDLELHDITQVPATLVPLHHGRCTRDSERSEWWQHRSFAWKASFISSTGSDGTPIFTGPVRRETRAVGRRFAGKSRIFALIDEGADGISFNERPVLACNPLHVKSITAVRLTVSTPRHRGLLQPPVSIAALAANCLQQLGHSRLDDDLFAAQAK
jgi:hypothetical protein